MGWGEEGEDDEEKKAIDIVAEENHGFLRCLRSCPRPPPARVRMVSARRVGQFGTRWRSVLIGARKPAAGSPEPPDGR